MKKKTVALLLACVMLIGVAMGGTLAWLMDATPDVVNTFTVGDIEIELTETDAVKDTEKNKYTKNFDFVPGDKIAKDPKVTVLAESEACWLFIEVVEDNNESGFIVWNVNSEWTKLESETTRNVYYRSITETEAEEGKSLYILSTEGTGDYANGYVTVSTAITEAQAEAMETAKPTLTFKAYAVQSKNLTTNTADYAWSQAKDATPNTIPNP